MSPDWQVSQVASSPIMRRMMKAKPMLTPTPNSMRKSVSMDSMPLPGPRVAALNEVREACFLFRNGDCNQRRASLFPVRLKIIDVLF